MFKHSNASRENTVKVGKRRGRSVRRDRQHDHIDKGGSAICFVTGVVSGAAVPLVNVRPVYDQNFTLPGQKIINEESIDIIQVPYGATIGALSVWVPPSEGMFGILVQTDYEVGVWLDNGAHRRVSTLESRRNDRGSGVFLPLAGSVSDSVSLDDRIRIGAPDAQVMVTRGGANIVANGCDMLETIAGALQSLGQGGAAAALLKIRGDAR